jgi:predicted transcriptional regulator
MVLDLEVAGRVLTPENCRLISLIRSRNPSSIKELCEISDRAQPNVSRALGVLVASGVVKLVGSRPKRPQLASHSIVIDVGAARLPPAISK